MVVIIIWSRYCWLFWALWHTCIHPEPELWSRFCHWWTNDNKLQTTNNVWYSSNSLADLYIFNLLGVTLQTLSAYYKVYMSQQTHRASQVLHGLQLQIVLTLKMKNINLQLRRWSRPTKQNRDQHNPCRTQSISWLKVTRLYQSSNIALELFRICRKGASPLFIINTTRPEQTRGYSLVWSIHWLTCDKPVSAQLPL